MRCIPGTEDLQVEKKRITDKELTNIAAELGIPGDSIEEIAPFICDEDGNEYEVWSVRTAGGRYVLKKAKGLETECYSSFFSGGKPYAPAFLGSCRYGNDVFLLLEYCPGETLKLDEPEMLRKTIDALAQMQDEFWQREDLCGSAVTMERALKAVEDRGRYLNSAALEQAYAKFTELYKTIPRTLSHEDLLPINVLVGERAVLIDWEYGGVLPYLSSFARLIAHGREDEGAYFHITEENRRFAIQYYFDTLVKKHGISYRDYLRELDCFLFYEYCEWVMLGNRYDSRDDERYSYYLGKAEETAARLLSSEHGKKEDHPRPLMRREQWTSLDGEWNLCGRKINVPYPPQAPLSGWDGEVPEHLVYEKEFILPKTGDDRRVILHFGAVDQKAAVFVNGEKAGTHEGGYLPFSFDITGLLHEGNNLIRVEAEDALSHDYPYGKQTNRPGGMWYTQVSGIWQTVWTETVPDDYITDVSFDTDTESIAWNIRTSAGNGAHISVSDDRGEVISSDAAEGKATVPEGRRHLWTPEDPFLYDIRISTPGGDEVSSYLALRTVTSETRDGIPRVCLNGRPVFLHGVLDQGYFPQGIFLPDSGSAYEKDIIMLKSMGFNTIRKHIKIEPERFYFECDRLGMLVIQDMVNSGEYSFLRDTALPTVGFRRRSDRKKRTGTREAFFIRHMTETAEHLHSHPCVIAFTVFNEGWGQFNADEAYDLLKAQEPSRLIDAASGWFAQSKSDFDSEHVYFRTKKLRPGTRPMLLSECGGFVLDTDPENRKGSVWGYGKCTSSEELTARIEDMYERMVIPAVGRGLCGSIYTQISDVENELNGLTTYDRTRIKVDAARMKKLSEEIYSALNG